MALTINIQAVEKRGIQNNRKAAMKERRDIDLTE